MLDLFYKKNGSITIFLSIVLVPTLIFMSIMVDTSSYVLSKSMVESAGELAVNGVLADYDTVLKDVYGLFAMSQKAEDPQAALKQNVTDYFNNSLKANGIIPEQVDWDSETMEWINDVLNGAVGIDDESIDTLVDVTLADTSTIQYMENSNLANPAVLKSQIVEYSKYRVPINAALSAIDSLGAFKKVEGQSKVVESKTRVDDALSDFTEKLSNLYKNIVKMDEAIGEYEAALQEVMNRNDATDFTFSDLEKALELCHCIIVEIELDPLMKYDKGSYSGDFDELYYVKSDGSICKMVNGSEVAVTPDSWASNKTLTEIEEEFDSVKEDVDEWIAEHATETSKVVGYGTYGGMNDTTSSNTSDTANPTKLKAAMKEYEKIQDELHKLGKIIAAIDNAEIDDYEYPEWTDEELGLGSNPTDAEREKAIEDKEKEYDEDMEEAFEEDKSSKRTELLGELDDYYSMSGKYMTAMQRYQNTFKRCDTLLRKTLLDIHDLLYPIAEKAAALSKKHTDWQWFDTSRETLISQVTKDKGEVVAAIKELDKKIEEMETSINNYNGEYTNGAASDDFSSTMLAELKEIRGKYNVEDFDEIDEQVNAISKYFNSDSNPIGVFATLDAYSLGDISIVGYYDGLNNTSKRDELVKKLIKKYKDNSTVKSYWSTAKTSTYFRFDENTYQTMVNVDFDMSKSVLYKACEDSTNPWNKYNTDKTCYLKKIGEAKVKVATGEEINVPAAYLTMITLFGIKPKEGQKISKDTLESYQETEETQAADDNEKNTDFAYDAGIFAGVPSGATSDGLSADKKETEGMFAVLRNAITTFTDIFQGIGNIASAGVVDGAGLVVDNMLVTEYILSTFSLYTDRLDEEGSVKTEDSEDKKYTYSNVEINAANNPLYGCEIEYILYGKKQTDPTKFLFFTIKEGKGPEVNVNEAKASIFAVRLMFNMIFAMTDAKIDKETLPPAMAIQAASQGVFPYQVAQSVMKLALALAESNYDVEQIMENQEMPLMKTTDTWVFQLSGMKDLMQDYVKEGAEELKAVTHENVSGLQEALNTGLEDFDKLRESYLKDITAMAKGSVEDSVNAASQAYTSVIEAYYQDMLLNGTEYNLEQLKTDCNKAVEEYLSNSGVDSSVSELISGTLSDNLDEMLVSGGDIDNALKGLNSKLKDPLTNAEEIASSFSTTMETISTKTLEAFDAISLQVDSVSAEISEEIKKEAESVIQKAADGINENADVVIDDLSAQLSEKINTKMEQYFPASSVKTDAEMGANSTSSSMAKTFNMGYEEYIRIFLLIKLFGDNSDEVITRVADVMQINVAKGLSDYTSKESIEHPKGEAFKMKNANTYVEISADIKVKPLLISQDWFEDISGGRIEYLKYQYNTVGGY